MKAITVIPEPKKILLRKGSFILNKECRIAGGSDSSRLIGFLWREIKTIANLELRIEDAGIPGMWIKILKGKGGIKAGVEYELRGLMEEGYILDVKVNSITIVSAKPAGIFYGIQTLLQLLEDDRKIRCCYIRGNRSRANVTLNSFQGLIHLLRC